MMALHDATLKPLSNNRAVGHVPQSQISNLSRYRLTSQGLSRWRRRLPVLCRDVMVLGQAAQLLARWFADGTPAILHSEEIASISTAKLLRFRLSGNGPRFDCAYFPSADRYHFSLPKPLSF
jgi:hypothetical protein